MNNPVKIAGQRRRRAELRERGLTVRGTEPVRQRHPEFAGLSWRERNTAYCTQHRAELAAQGLTSRGVPPLLPVSVETLLNRAAASIAKVFVYLPPEVCKELMAAGQSLAAINRKFGKKTVRVRLVQPVPDFPISK